LTGSFDSRREPSTWVCVLHQKRSCLGQRREGRTSKELFSPQIFVSFLQHG
jgi:hypothetical protein